MRSEQGVGQPFEAAHPQKAMTWRLAIVLMVIVLASRAAFSQRLLVTTKTLTVTREAVRTYLQSVDLVTGESLPMPALLPGQAVISRILLTDDSRGAVVSSGASWFGGPFTEEASLTFTTGFHTAPFQAAGPLFMSIEGWRQRTGCLVKDPATGDTAVVVLGARVDENGAWLGRFEVFSWQSGRGISLFPKPPVWTLPGAPVAAAALPAGRQVAILCTAPLGAGALLHVRDAFSGEVLVEGNPVADDATAGFGADPCDLALSRDGKYVLIATSGYLLDRPSGRAVSWLHALDTSQFAPYFDPIELPGWPRPETTLLHSGQDGRCWLATYTPGTDFGYACAVKLTEDAAAKEVEVPFTGVNSPLHIVCAPDGPAVAVAAENRLEIWPEGQPVGPVHPFEATIQALAWTKEGLFVGEGANIHQVAPESGDVTASVSLMTGIIEGVISLNSEALPSPDSDADGLTDQEEAALATSPLSCDTDHDGVPDGSDPEPLAPSAKLIVPPVITFRGEAAGRELRALMVMASGNDTTTGYVDFDPWAMPWLRLYPRSGILPQAFYLGVDPVSYGAPNRVLGDMLLVRAQAERGQVAGSPACVAVRVLPKQNHVARILWMHDEPPAADHLKGDAASAPLAGLTQLLSGPPLHFSHRTASGFVAEPLDPYAIVVLGARVAARGALTRSAVLDFVAGGGALLFLGEFGGSGPGEVLASWLTPIGIHLNASVAVDGVFSSASDHELCRHWGAFAIRHGMGLYVDDPTCVLVRDPHDANKAVFVARGHGYGRIAVLAASTPLENTALVNADNRQFALDLFHWLSRAGRETDDLDADGLPDRLEDKNGNGFCDPGETNHLLADTDGDGVPDGMEDRNRNGQADEGETSPLNADSDNDGIPDGADINPLPPADAPHLVAVEPPETPAEGGSNVLISGRNLPPDGIVWFGSRRATHVRSMGPKLLAVQTPPCVSPEGGPVDVRFLNPVTGTEAVLPAGFRYTPRSVVTLSLQVIQAAQKQYEGAVSLRMTCPPGATVGRIIVCLEAEPQDALSWTSVSPGVASEYAVRRVISRPTATGGLWIDVSAGKRGPEEGEIAVAHYATSAPLETVAPIRIRLASTRISALNGQPLEATVQDVELVNPPSLANEVSASEDSAELVKKTGNALSGAR